MHLRWAYFPLKFIIHDVTLFPVQYIDEYVQSFLQGASGSSSAVVPLQLDASGKVKYDALARMGQSKDKVRTVRMTAGHFVCNHKSVGFCVS